MKNAFHFILRVLFAIEIFTFLSWLFGYVEKRFDKKVKINFKMYEVAAWTINSSNACTVQHLKK